MSSDNELNASGVTFINLCISSQPCSGIQGNGLERELFSKEMLPFKKKSSSSGFSLPSASMILMVIWKENKSLWRSNRPTKTLPTLKYNIYENLSERLLAQLIFKIWWIPTATSYGKVTIHKLFKIQCLKNVLCHPIPIQTLKFLTALPTRQDGVENRA